MYGMVSKIELQKIIRKKNMFEQACTTIEILNLTGSAIKSMSIQPRAHPVMSRNSTDLINT